jgi:hypothetical protein
MTVKYRAGSIIEFNTLSSNIGIVNKLNSFIKKHETHSCFFYSHSGGQSMSTINTKASVANAQPSREQLDKGHLNHMAGVSYDIKNPLLQLRVVASSCFFGEPMYYHDDKKSNTEFRSHLNDKATHHGDHFGKYLDSVLTPVLNFPEYRHFSPARLLETAIDEALNFDAEGTLKEAVRLRQEENIRTTPQVIMVRAAHHDKVRGTGLIKLYADKILARTDEVSVQLAYQMRVYGQPIPNALKKAWKAFLEKRTEYDLSKYRMENRAFKTVDVVNLVHAKSAEIDSLMKGTLKLSEEDTWEALISKEGSTRENWEKAISLMGHMALLRNLRNFHEKSVNPDLYLDKLVKTAKNGKQLPFRYFSAHSMIKSSGVSGRVLDAVEQCLELSLGELPQFKGKVMSLCDNSGSAQGTTTSKMGSMKVNHIANLTGVITGKVSDDGYVGVFGDGLEVIPVRKNASVFDQVDVANRAGDKIGQGTENGIWMFFDKAIKEKQHWDHIFVYSDMQAGHGGLYGIDPHDYRDYRWNSSRYIDVAKLIRTYREKVNADVKVYLVQVAGYKDTLVPEFYDKTYILGGWGDGLLRFAHSMAQLGQKPVGEVSQASPELKTKVGINVAGPKVQVRKKNRFKLDK